LAKAGYNAKKRTKREQDFPLMRSPSSNRTVLTDPHRAVRLQRWRLPLFANKIAAGFPSPADDYVEKTLDLNELLVKKPAATFFARAQGESMLGAGIHPNDILVVDRSLEAVPGKIVICALNGELVVKRLKREADQWILASENPFYPDILLHEELEMVIWGVVTNVIHGV
jgi:DNA polymerase V